MDFISYDYYDVTINRQYLDVYRDNYVYFGWKAVDFISKSKTVVVLKLRRHRNVGNKIELTRLQKKFESIMVQISKFDHMNQLIPKVHGYLLGLIGTIFMGLAFLTYKEINLIVALVIFVPGLVGWILPPFIVKVSRSRRISKTLKLRNDLFDEVIETCQKAYKLSSQYTSEED